MKYILYFHILFFLLKSNAQTKTWESWILDADNYLSSIDGSEEVGSAEASICQSSMYFEGFNEIVGFTRLWQASGDFKYLDRVLDMIEFDIDNSIPNLATYFNSTTFSNGNPGGFWRPLLPYAGNIQLPNFWLQKYGYQYPTQGSFSYYDPPEFEYLNAADQLDFSYLYSTANYPQYDWTTNPLNGTIYWRYVADLLRIMNHNSSILPLVSNTGETYQLRYNSILSWIELNVWEKWSDPVSYPSDSRHLEYYKYRVNTHMTTHMGSISVSLYSITGEQKYLDYVNELLYDFGTGSELASGGNPNRQHIPVGIGFLDQIEVYPSGALVWQSGWGNLPGSNGSGQDVTHFPPEANFLVQCYEEGIASTSVDGHIAIDASFIDGLTKTVTLNVINGDPLTSTQINYRIHEGDNGTVFSNKKAATGQGMMDLATWDSDILAFLENNTSGEISFFGHGAYAARIHGINGATPPVYPTMGVGGGTAPVNNAPNVVLIGDEVININVGDTYTEQGATYNDIQDGSGSILNPTSGTVDTNTSGVYTLDYTYNDLGTPSLSDTATRTVNVIAVGNDCPTLTLNGDSIITIEINQVYTEQGATYNDIQDGSGVANIAGDVVDNTTIGDYIVSYSYTDSDQCQTSITRLVKVQDTSSNVLVNDIVFNSNIIQMIIGDNVNIFVDVLPINATNKILSITKDENEILLPSGDSFVADEIGTGKLTFTTTDGGLVSKSLDYVVWYEEGSVMYKLFKRQQGNTD